MSVLKIISFLSFYVCLISVLSFYVCCLGGRECADAFRLISVLSFYVGFEDNFFSVFLCLLGHSVSIQQIYASHSTTSDFDKNFHRMFTNVLEMLCKILQQYYQYSFFGGILKTSLVIPIFAICKLRFNLLQHSASHNPTIIEVN